MKRILIYVLSALALCSCCGKFNNNYMWFDCEANYAVLSDPDSIDFYLHKVKDLGFDNVVVDVKSIMGDVLYDSDIAPFMGEFKGVRRAKDYDMMGRFIETGHSLGMRVFASMNIFAGGHKYFKWGIIYGEHPEWQSICYTGGKLVPIADTPGYNGMLNPSNPEVQNYQISILKEFFTKYRKCDGIIFDRVRYDGITSDFSELSRRQFEEYSASAVENFPEDIISWYDEEGNLRDKWVRGPRFNEWVEWRAGVIHDFVERAHKEIKSIRRNIIIGDYTGAWYDTYYELGVNWASKNFDPSETYDWATPNYKNTGYAEMLDVYMTGLYYTVITKAEMDETYKVVGENGESALQLSLNYNYTVEGGAEFAERITEGAKAPLVGSVYVDQFAPSYEKFGSAVKQCLESTDGVMVFDFCHIRANNLWDVLEDAM